MRATALLFLSMIYKREEKGGSPSNSKEQSKRQKLQFKEDREPESEKLSGEVPGACSSQREGDVCVRVCTNMTSLLTVVTRGGEQNRRGHHEAQLRAEQEFRSDRLQRRGLTFALVVVGTVQADVAHLRVASDRRSHQDSDQGPRGRAVARADAGPGSRATFQAGP